METTTGLARSQSSVPPIRLFALCCPQISANTPKLKEHGILISDWSPSSLTAARWVPGTLGTRFLVPISDKLLCYAADKSTTGPVVDVDASSPLGVSSTRSPIRCLSLHHGVECSEGCRGFLCVCVLFIAYPGVRLLQMIVVLLLYWCLVRMARWQCGVPTHPAHSPFTIPLHPLLPKPPRLQPHSRWITSRHRSEHTVFLLVWSWLCRPLQVCVHVGVPCAQVTKMVGCVPGKHTQAALPLYPQAL